MFNNFIQVIKIHLLDIPRIAYSLFEACLDRRLYTGCAFIMRETQWQERYE